MLNIQTGDYLLTVSRTDGFEGDDITPQSLVEAITSATNNQGVYKGDQLKISHRNDIRGLGSLPSYDGTLDQQAAKILPTLNKLLDPSEPIGI